MYHTEYALAVISYGAAPNRFSKKMDLPCFFFPFRTWIPPQHKLPPPPQKRVSTVVAFTDFKL